jgi:hypothetical protein
MVQTAIHLRVTRSSPTMTRIPTASCSPWERFPLRLPNGLSAWEMLWRTTAPLLTMWRGRSICEERASAACVRMRSARSDTSFTRQTKVRLPGATDADVAIVRRYQPDSPQHCLMVLKDSSNLDKHRALQVLPVHIARSQLTINHLVDCELVNGTGFSLIQSDPIQPGAEIGRFPVTPTGPNSQAYMDGRFGMEPSINSKVWLRPWLNETQRFIGSLLAEWGDPPAGVLYVPPDALE